MFRSRRSLSQTLEPVSRFCQHPKVFNRQLLSRLRGTAPEEGRQLQAHHQPHAEAEA